MSYFWAFLEYGVVIGMIVFLLFHRIGVFAATPREEIDDLSEEERLRSTEDPIATAETELRVEQETNMGSEDAMKNAADLAGSNDAETVAALLRQVGVDPTPGGSLRK